MKFQFFMVMLMIWVLAVSVVSAEIPVAEHRYVVAFAQDTLANDWRAAQVRDIQRALADYPDIEFVYSDAQGDTARQIEDIERFSSMGVDVLITSPRDAALMREPIARVYRKGIPVILLSRRVEGDEYTQFISADNRSIARQAARYLAQQLSGSGDILMLQGVPTASAAIERTEGFLDELGHYPELNVSTIVSADYLRSLAILGVESAIAESVAFDAIYAQSDSMAIGAIMALKMAGRDPIGIPVTGIDYISEARDFIRNGEINVSFTFPTAGREGAEAAVRLLRGEILSAKHLVIDSIAVTRDNVNEIEPIF